MKPELTGKKVIGHWGATIPETLGDTVKLQEFVVVQERTKRVQYTVEAENMSDAVLQIENGNYDCVIDSRDLNRRIISVGVYVQDES